MRARIAIVNKQLLRVNEKRFYENHDVMRSRAAKTNFVRINNFRF